MTLKGKIIGRFLLTFLIGIVLGTSLDRILIRRHILALFGMRTEGIMGPLRDDILSHVLPEQRAAVEKILRDHGQRFAETDDRFRREMDESMETLFKELGAFLSPEKIVEIRRSFSPPAPRPGEGPPGKPPFDEPPPGPRRPPGPEF